MAIQCQKILLSRNCDVNGPNKCRKAPIHFAASLGKASAVQLLCEESRDCVDETDDSLKTPLMLAAINGNV